MSLSATVPVRLMRVSASVDLPWSMCAMMEKLRMFLAGTWSTAFGSILTLSPFLLGTTGVSAARTRTARLPESRGRRVGKNLADASPPPPSRARARARAAPSVAPRAAEGAMPDIALGRFALNPTTGEPARTVYPRRALCPSSVAPGRVTVASGSGLDSSSERGLSCGIVRPLPPRGSNRRRRDSVFPVYTNRSVDQTADNGNPIERGANKSRLL